MWKIKRGKQQFNKYVITLPFNDYDVLDRVVVHIPDKGHVEHSVIQTILFPFPYILSDGQSFDVFFALYTPDTYCRRFLL